MDDTSLPIACTLEGPGYQQRIEWIAELNRDGLRRHTRSDLILELVYTRDVADRVHQMVRQEETCCAFLQFDVDDSAGDLRVTVRAPQRARAVADSLFDQFTSVKSAHP